MSTPQRQQQTPGSNAGPAAKRRRVEIANSTLRKPFRSPLLTRPLGPGPRSPSSGPGVTASPSSGVGIGQSPLGIKSRVGEGLSRRGGEEDEDEDEEDDEEEDDEEEDEEEDESSALVVRGTAAGNEGEDGGTTIAREGDEDIEVDDAGVDLQNLASPSMRGSTIPNRVGRGRGSRATLESKAVERDATGRVPPPLRQGQRQESRGGGLSNRQYPSPSKSTTTQAAAGATPLRRGVFTSRNTDISSLQTASKKPPPLFSSTGGAGSSRRNHPTTPVVTNRSNSTAVVTPHPNQGDEKDSPHQHEDILTKLRNARRETQSRLSEAQKQLDLVKQARRIQDKGSIQELIVLIEKWKCASRAAAEDLFELIRKRVDDMGGSRAWRDSRRRGRGGWGSGFDEEDGNGSGRRRRHRNGRRGGGGSDDDYGEYGEEDGEDEDEEDDEEEEEEEEEEEDTGFTMAMMLQSLNIDPEQLGWDPAEEKWRE